VTDVLLDGWRARIRDSGGRIYGAGVLVAPDLVVTCAHVVARALQASPNGERPPAPVSVDFPTATHLGSCSATVVEDGWLAMADDYAGDIALLRLAEPKPLPAASFAACGVPWRRRIRVFGHPRSSPDVGEWATADMTGTAGPRGEWVQINSQQVGPQIVGGFSGAGVLDESGSVIGLLIASDNNPTTRGAWMVTAEAMVRLLPVFGAAVGELTASAPGTPPEHRRPPVATDPGRFRYEMQIVETLLTLEGIGGRARRDEFAHHLERVLGRALGAGRDDRPRSDLLNIIVACLDQPDPGGLSALADVASLLYGDTPASRSLRRLAAGDPGRRLTRREIERLEVLIANLPSEAVAAAARAAFGAMGQRGDLDSADPAELVRALSELTGPVGEPPPLLVFFHRLTERTDGLDREALRQWTDHFARRWGLSPDELVFAGPAAPPLPTKSSLVVTLEEDGPEPNTYLPSVSLDHDNGEQTPLVVHDQPLTLDEVPGHLGLHLRRVTGRSLGPVGALTIEFVLPYELLSHPVDQWRISAGEPTTRPLGAQYSVVVRSLDRMQSTIYHHRWAARWRFLRAHEQTPHAQAIGFVQPTGSSA
jgi:vWA-MoxR associated protein C-terminal domain/Trypsin-like peptidase domain/vWA-MoxR associated protein middle region 0/Effector-associated domain 2